MLAIIAFIVLVYIGYRLWAKPDATGQEDPTITAVRETARNFRNDLAPVKEQVKTATTNARKTFEEAQFQKQVTELAQNPKLLLAAIDAAHAGIEKAEQEAKTTGE